MDRTIPWMPTFESAGGGIDDPALDCCLDHSVRRPIQHTLVLFFNHFEAYMFDS